MTDVPRNTQATGVTDLQRKMLAYDETVSCVQCGYCLPACPTYMTMGKETHSPRGRINLVKMTAEGKLSDLSLLADAIDKCLGCRACETACPSGVQYGKIFESARTVIEQTKPRSAAVQGMRKLLFKHVFPKKRTLRLLANGLWLYQRSGLQRVVRKSGLLRHLPYHLGEFERLLPPLPSPSQRANRPLRFEAPGPRDGRPRYRIAFFTGCVMDAVFENINRLSMLLLKRAGCEVVLMRSETCCGALHAHAGEMELARQLAKQNILAYEEACREQPIDYIVNNAGGCGAMLTEYAHLFADDAEWAPRAREFAEKSRDISQVLAELGPLPFAERGEAEKVIVTYQRSCHMTNVQKVTREPLQLIKSIPGVELREMDDADKCCGSAGIYNIVRYDEAMEILDAKMQNVKKTEAHVVVTTNPGCLLQMQKGILREGLEGRMRAVHLVELLAEACGIE